MKAPCTLFATVIAASTIAISSSCSSENKRLISYVSPNEEFSLSSDARTSRVASSVEDKKFSPKFDGLRFIETLVTAHR